MKHRLIVLLSIMLIIMVTGETNVTSVKAVDGESPEFAESVNVSVNCTTANIYIISMVVSNDTSLAHFPPEVDMNRVELIDATSVSLGFTTIASALVFIFNNTETATATALADAVKGSIETAFATSFTYNSTGTNNGYVNVSYTGPGKENLTEYTDWLIEKCLASDLGGFSLTFIPMSSNMNALTLVSAYKESGGFNWVYSMGVGYSTNIPIGIGNHKIDILNLLNVESLAPSPYGDPSTSMASLTVISNETVSYASCEPGLASPPDQLRGWYIVSPSPTQLVAYFIFGDDPSPVSPLSFTFSGLVIPEFTGPILVIMSIITTAIAVIIKKQFPNK